MFLFVSNFNVSHKFSVCFFLRPKHIINSSLTLIFCGVLRKPFKLLLVIIHRTHHPLIDCSPHPQYFPYTCNFDHLPPPLPSPHPTQPTPVLPHRLHPSPPPASRRCPPPGAFKRVSVKGPVIAETTLPWRRHLLGNMSTPSGT